MDKHDVLQPSGSGAGLLFLMSSLWSPCSEGFGLKGQIRPLRGIPFAGLLTARVSAFADDITVLVSAPKGHRGCEEGGC